MARASRKIASTRRSPPWAVDDYLSYLLARAGHVVASQFHREVKAAGLTVLEWRVLAVLADGRARNVGELATFALAQQPTVTKLLQRLETEGRVARHEGEADRRQSLVTITPRGRAALGKLLTRAKEHERETVALLSAREIASLKSVLHQLIDAA